MRFHMPRAAAAAAAAAALVLGVTVVASGVTTDSSIPCTQTDDGTNVTTTCPMPVHTATETVTATVPGPTATVTQTVTATPTLAPTPTPTPTPTTPPAVNYGGTSGWGPATVVDLSHAPAGTTYTNGVRASTDQSYNRQSQATFGPDGLTIAAQKIGGTIYSADVMMHGVDVPDQFAVEADIDMEGTGPGVGHAFWFRPFSGSNGEVDGLEYIGSNAGKGISGGPGNFEAKATLIRTGSPTYNIGSKAFGLPTRSDGTYNGMRHYRFELTTSAYSVWVDGILAGSITKAQFEAANGAGSWSQFAAGTHWYPRLTLQVNNGTSAKLWGTVPASWTGSTIRLAALRIYGR